MRTTIWIFVALGLINLASGCFVSRAKYDRSLGVLSRYQADRLQTEADRDAAVAKMQTMLDDQSNVLAQTRANAAKEKAGLEAEVAASREELAAVREQRALTEKRMEEWKRLTSKLAQMISSGKIKVSIRDGRMLVDLPSSVLFASGSADLQAAGKPTLAEVAKVLKEFPGRQFVVAGHTDNVPINPKTSPFKDNWELSAARALTVTKFLIENGLKPSTISAAGYGEYDPVATNANPRGQQLNRRIEIVLMPNLAELPKMPTGI
jgi:chemotaxis protein MotB